MCMTEVFIHGRMGSLIGKYFKLNCRNLGELFSAIECNTGAFKKYLRLNKNRKFSIFVDGKNVDSAAISIYRLQNSTVHILPILMGALGITIVAAVGGAAFAKTAAGMIIAGVINAAISFGISMLLSKLLAPDDPDVRNTSSLVFGSPENVSEQGVPVPVGYGRLRVAGKILSVGSLSVDKRMIEQPDFYSTTIANNVLISKNEFSDQGGSSFSSNVSETITAE